MKRDLLFILVVGASMCLSARKKGETEGKTYIVETNCSGAGWFISDDVGGQVYFSDNDGKADFGKRIAPALDIAVGKWPTPGIGLRVTYSSLQAEGAVPSANNLYIKGGKYSNGHYRQRWNMANFHGGVLFSLSNMFCGYNEGRLHSFISYVSAGVALSWSEPHQQNLGVNADLINRFRVPDVWGIDLELRGFLMGDAFGGASKEGMAGVIVGVAYKFKRCGFNAVPTVPMISESQLDGMRSRLNSLKGEDESLKCDLVEIHNRKPEVIVKREGGFVSCLVVVFNTGRSNVSRREYMNVGTMAKGIKANPEKIFTVTGYANKGTGSAEYSMKLSKKGAEAMCDLMVNGFGVLASQLRIDYKDGVDNMFYDDARSSRVVIMGE